MRGRQLLQQVTEKRLRMIETEVEQCFPGAVSSYEFRPDGRVHIQIDWEGITIGEEYVETASSWNQPGRILEYREVLTGNRKRLVILVPERHARAARLKMLDLNHWWLFYYQVFGYDHEGSIKRQGRPMHCFAEPGYV